MPVINPFRVGEPTTDLPPPTTPTPTPTPTNPGATTNNTSPTRGQRPAIYNQINDFFKRYLGRDGSEQELGQWGANIDDQYLSTIGNSIYSSAEARAYRANGNQRTPYTPPTTDLGPDDPSQHDPRAKTGLTNKTTRTGSPVDPTGRIPPQDPGDGRGVPVPNDNWPTAPDRTLNPVDLSKVPAYQAFRYNVNTPAAYKAGTMPDAYAGYKFDQFNGPNQNFVNEGENPLIAAILANPETMNANVVAQLKEQNKTGALDMRNQFVQQNDQNGVARGSLGSGALDANNRLLNEDLMSKVLNGNTNIDIRAAETNRGDVLNALTAAEQLAGGQLSRATGAYGARLAGQNAQAGDTRNVADSNMQRALAIEQQHQAEYDSNFRNSDLSFNVQHAQADENYRSSSDAVNRLLQQFNINRDTANTRDNSYRSDILGTSTKNNYELDFRRYLENQRQFNNTLGFSYNQLDQNQYQFLLDWLARNGAPAGNQ